MLAMPHDPARRLLRHTLATLAYRGGKTLRDAPGGFATFSIAPGTRTPAAILAHIGDLLDWAIALADGRHDWHNAAPLSWTGEVARFFAAIGRLDDRLASNAALACPPERLFQGPVADALTHVGQLGLLRRLAGAPVRGENYFQARVTAGMVGPDQPPPEVEFD
jgi:hypothetical protein